MDQYFIGEAFKLAKKGLSWTWPNPMVGAVIVKNGKIIGKGYHRKVGDPHAEIEAIGAPRSDLAKLKGATLYINLEPCSHFGKTPPCTDAIIKSKIARVVCSTPDPNPKVAGKGIKRLEQAGIDVSVEVLEQQAKKLNETFFTFHTKKRPFVAIKFAASLDGKIATRTGDSKWITNERAREYARNLRAYYQAVLVGVNTVIVDDPHLGVRQKDKKDPIRIILDPHSRIPQKAQVLRDTNVLIINEQITIPRLLTRLKERDIISILVEGGGNTLGHFVDCGLVDKVYAFHAPIVIGGQKAVSAVEGKGAAKIGEALHLRDVKFRKFDDTILTTGYAS